MADAGMPLNRRPVTVRCYSPDDEQGWLRCRALAFLSTAYFDDVLTAKAAYAGGAEELVADVGGTVVGLIDVSIDGQHATIETVAVHPDLAREGIGSLLLDEAIRRLPEVVTSLDAWTRDDEAANEWYVANGFGERFRYLHVYAGGEHEPGAAIAEARHGLTPVAAFFHADISEEAELRRASRECTSVVSTCARSRGAEGSRCTETAAGGLSAPRTPGVDPGGAQKPRVAASVPRSASRGSTRSPT
jgi:ribosomal protein S18 acetylase RimI-like enzyme